MNASSLLSFAILATATLSAAVPGLINYQGLLTDTSGNPVSGSKTFSLKVFDAATNGTELYTETIGAQTVTNGVYSFTFGSAGTSTASAAEVIGTTAGSGTVYSKLLSGTPLTGTLAVTDGTYAWNDVTGNGTVQATATSTVVSGFVVGATVSVGGSGYTIPPVVTITGNGTGATATATVSGGAVTAINITSAGSGYSTGATITVAAPPAPFNVTFTGGTLTAIYDPAPPAGRTITATYQQNSGGITSSLAASQQWLQLTVDGVVQTPRERLVAVPFALKAGTADVANSVAPGSVTATGLASGAAASNLSQGGFAAVPANGIILSSTENSSLVNAGYVKVGAFGLPGTEVANKSPSLNAPDFAIRYVAAWSGTEMIVWGWDNNAIGVGGKYNPQNKSWTNITGNSSLNLLRDGLTSIWTGSKMIIWGGARVTVNDVGINEGAIFDPNSNTWINTSITNAPSGRLNHIAIWTGTKMIIWGGMSTGTSGESSSGTRINTGSIYDVQSDTWTAMSAINAPSPRSEVIPIWTGSELIIWGGRSSPNTFLGDGFKFNPTTNTWTTMSNINAPSSRCRYASCWTGSEMIVWAGYNTYTSGQLKGGNVLAGKRYNPETNSWSNISLTGSIVEDYNSLQVAVWTGSEVYFNNSGPSYRPSTDTWIPRYASGIFNSLDRPLIWTGNEFLNPTSLYRPGSSAIMYQK